MLFPSLNQGKKNIFEVLCCHHPQTPSRFWKEPYLFTNALLCSNSSQYAMIFCQSLIRADFFISEIVPFKLATGLLQAMIIAKVTSVIESMHSLNVLVYTWLSVYGCLPYCVANFLLITFLKIYTSNFLEFFIWLGIYNLPKLIEPNFWQH